MVFLPNVWPRRAIAVTSETATGINANPMNSTSQNVSRSPLQPSTDSDTTNARTPAAIITTNANTTVTTASIARAAARLLRPAGCHPPVFSPCPVTAD